jgi:hypothetical protein
MKFLSMNDQDRQEFAHLHAPLGEPGSGRVRYAAAMYFHGRGLLTDEHLEAYRICAKDDHADPHLLMAGGSQ